ncbi:lysophospholipid acyltransferase family protein [Pseudarthrobacter sp. PS3-L1]|uniref:lysophospholipid acyltransferase family protein n=1 Tax=Pseudarthrobacter sp. PS3-L1 TaxID=3046207 RepID=UPI0024BB8D15|nr:lysophospholipid acyltransferase family protein [Pseudarthrobacter sp. PS3-L1]MDJ0319745.1 lysophospholipid acyltransferase family protein [Pseudarthrobacter sp. PS3-L1]
MAWRPASNDRFYRMIVRTGQSLRRVFGVRFIVTGEDRLPPATPSSGPSRMPVPGQGAIIAITHFGYLDFAVAELVLWKKTRAQLRFMVHQGAADHWIAGPAVSASGHVVVGYNDRSLAYDQAVAKLKAGEYLAILPEAGVSRSFKVRECRTGAVRMAAEAGVPVIPVSVWGAHRLLTRGHGFSIRRAWRAPVRVHVGETLRYAPDAAIEPETERLRSILQQGIDRATADFPMDVSPGAWWMPADSGGSAPSEDERRTLDAQDAARGRRRGSQAPTP